MLFGERFMEAAQCAACVELRGPGGASGPTAAVFYTCRVCRRKWSDLKGTIFERTRTPLSKWFFALYEIAHGPGISARHLQVRLSVSYKTAWRMLHQIRRALRENQLCLVLTGVVEADETCLGGRRKGPRGRGARGKTPVVVLAYRGSTEVYGEVRIEPSLTSERAKVP